MKRLLLLLLLVVPLCATTVSDTIYMANGTLANGYLLIDFPFSCTGPSNKTIAASSVRVPVSDGAVSVDLEANDTCENTHYVVTYKLRNGSVSQDQTVYWVVPTSASPVLIDTVETTTITPPTVTFPVSLLTGVLGLANGGTNVSSWTASRCVQVNAGGTALESASAACSTGGVTDHALLTNLDYASSGHTGFEPTITAGTTAQYWRGDKTWATFAHDHSGDSLLPTNVTLTNLYFGGATSSDVLVSKRASGTLDILLGDGTGNASVYVNSIFGNGIYPAHWFNDTDATSGERVWRFGVDGTAASFAVYSDDFATTSDVIWRATRAATATAGFEILTDLQVYDDTVTTGKTSLSIRGGVANSTSGSTPVFTYFDNDGTTKRFWVQENGDVTTLGSFIGVVPNARVLTGGSGVATIGDLSADRTVDLDFGSESEDVAPAGADFVLVEDATVGGQFRKVQITNLPTSGTGDVVGPASSVAGEAVAFDGTTGKLIKVATGCSWSVSAGSKGYLSCDGGFSAGDGTYAGAWVTEETTANGGTYQFALFGPDAQAADRCIVFPDAQPADNQILKATATTASVAQDGKTWTGCRVMAWEADAGSGGPVTDDTVLVGNGTAGVEATLPACANATTSKLLYDQATNAFSCGTDQTGAGSAVDCTDPANSCLWDEFMAGEVGTNNISALGWRKTASTYVYQPGEDGAPGIFQVGSTTVLDDVASLSLAAGSTVEPLLAMDTKTFTLQMRFRTGRATDIGAHVGIKDDVAFGVNGDGFFLSFDTAAAETAYQYVVCDGTCYTADSGAAFSTLWRRVKITNDGGSVATFSLYDETGALVTGSTKTFCTAASGCDVNSVVFPTGATMQHVFVVVNRGSITAATIDAEYFSFQMTGLTR